MLKPSICIILNIDHESKNNHFHTKFTYESLEGGTDNIQDEVVENPNQLSGRTTFALVKDKMLQNVMNIVFIPEFTCHAFFCWENNAACLWEDNCFVFRAYLNTQVSLAVITEGMKFGTFLIH